MAAGTDVGVIGAGIVGLATAYAAAQEGLPVTVYDPSPPGNGQSAGHSRLFRHSHDDPRLVAMAIRSRELWRQWESEFGTELVSDDGSVALGPGIDDRLRVLAEFPDLPARRVGSDELAERMPLLAPFDGPAMLDETGGSIRTRAAIAALSEQVRDSLVTDHVITVRPTRGGTVELRTGSGRHEHDRVVVCAGRGTAALARGVGLSIPVHESAHARVTFAVRGTPPGRIATLQDGSGVFGETGVYAAAYPDNTHYALGLSHSTPAGADGSVADPTLLAQFAERASDYVATALPGLDPTPAGHVHCWVTELPWSDDGIAVWDVDNISFVAGHNLFKHAPALGRALASHITHGDLPDDLRPSARLGAG